MSNNSSNEKAATLAASALATLSKALAEGDSNSLKRYLIFCGRFHQYSFRNSLLIAFQRPEATFVAGFQRWKDLGRWVKKGEKGIAILVPITYKRKHESDETVDSRSTNSEEHEETLVGFTTGYVFDVAQTDGEPIPDLGRPYGCPGKRLNSLKELAKVKGISLTYADALGGARGVSKGGAITVLSGMGPAEEFQVLCHEIAHEMLHRGDRRAETTRQMRELEAESVAYAVSTAIGLDCTSSFDYIRLWNGDEKGLAHSLAYIQTVSSEILDFLL